MALHNRQVLTLRRGRSWYLNLACLSLAAGACSADGPLASEGSETAESSEGRPNDSADVGTAASNFASSGAADRVRRGGYWKAFQIML